MFTNYEKRGERFVELVTQDNETAPLSESSLGKDWNRPEEDEAWKKL